jgi:hypothetical protein
MCPHVVVNGGFNVEGGCALKYITGYTDQRLCANDLLNATFLLGHANQHFAACPVKMGEVMFGKRF